MIRKGIICIFFFIFIGNAYGLDHKASKPLDVWVYEDVYEDYLKFLHGRNPLEIQDYSGAYSRRDVIDVVLLQQVLHAGNYNTKLAFLTNLPTTQRMMHELEQGTFVMPATVVFPQDLPPNSKNIQLSAPLVRKEDFMVGIYMLKDNPERTKIHTLEQLQKLRAIVPTPWKVDISVLKEYGIQQIVYASNWKSANYMLKNNRADFILQPFQQTKNMDIEAFDNISLLPVPNVKLLFSKSRSFPVSLAHPEGKKIIEAMDKGIKIFRGKGRITRAYIESGFFNQQTKNWKLLSKGQSK